MRVTKKSSSSFIECQNDPRRAEGDKEGGKGIPLTFLSVYFFFRFMKEANRGDRAPIGRWVVLGAFAVLCCVLIKEHGASLSKSLATDGQTLELLVQAGVQAREAEREVPVKAGDGAPPVPIGTGQTEQNGSAEGERVSRPRKDTQRQKPDANPSEADAKDGQQCGALCDYAAFNSTPGLHWPVLHKAVDCKALWRASVQPYTLPKEAPKAIPHRMQAAFTMDGAVPVAQSFFPYSPSVAHWSADLTLTRTVCFCLPACLPD